MAVFPQCEIHVQGTGSRLQAAGCKHIAVVRCAGHKLSFGGIFNEGFVPSNFEGRYTRAGEFIPPDTKEWGCIYKKGDRGISLRDLFGASPGGTDSTRKSKNDYRVQRFPFCTMVHLMGSPVSGAIRHLRPGSLKNLDQNPEDII